MPERCPNCIGWGIVNAITEEKCPDCNGTGTKRESVIIRYNTSNAKSALIGNVVYGKTKNELG